MVTRIRFEWVHGYSVWCHDRKFTKPAIRKQSNCLLFVTESVSGMSGDIFGLIVDLIKSHSLNFVLKQGELYEQFKKRPMYLGPFSNI